ncbi:MAG: substrate-binding domain-containing protein [Ruminiclostridium sp.]|nr:substrate-binding domain-containing protein [Ruminiclostridium sp.]
MKKTIYIIAGQFKNDYMDKYVTGAMRKANELDYDTVTFSMSRYYRTKTNCEKDIYKLIDFSKCDGVILNAESFYELKNLAATVEQRIILSGKPYTVIGASAYTDNYFHYPYFDDMVTMVNHLIEEHGCRKIYCLGDVPDSQSSRIEGFKAAMKAHNLPCPQSYLLYGGFWIDCAERLAKDIAREIIEKPDAVMCINDQIANALVRAFYRNGISVPEDVLVAGLDGHPCAFNYELPITTVMIDGEHLGKTAMNRLHEMMGNEIDLVPIKKNRVKAGASCGCGARKSRHIRSRIEEANEYENYTMYYRNSEIQEKLYHINDYSELPIILDNLTYLVPNMSTFSVSLLRGQNQAECLFHSSWSNGDSTVKFDYRDILPPNGNMDSQVRNTHVVPISFNEKFYGYITAGYHQPNVYNEFLQKFIRDISIALDIYERHSGINAVSLPELKPERATTKAYPGMKHIDEDHDDMPENDSHTIYALKNGTLAKVNFDNILYFEAYEKKVNVVLKSGAYEVRNTLSELEEMMQTKNYMRVSKSILLNIDKVAAIKPETDRTVVAVLANKQEVRVSRRYAKEFKDRMKF